LLFFLPPEEATKMARKFKVGATNHLQPQTTQFHMDLPYFVLKYVTLLLVKLFYSEIEVRAQDNIPNEGPVRDPPPMHNNLMHTCR
jgi:hypothetical protein